MRRSRYTKGHVKASQNQRHLPEGLTPARGVNGAGITRGGRNIWHGST